MACNKSNILSFNVFELGEDLTEYDTGKSFSISKEEDNALLLKWGFTQRPYDIITSTAVVIAMFEKVYNFNEGTRGHCLRWEKLNHTGVIYWRKDSWRVKRII